MNTRIFSIITATVLLCGCSTHRTVMQPRGEQMQREIDTRLDRTVTIQEHITEPVDGYGDRNDYVKATTGIVDKAGREFTGPAGERPVITFTERESAHVRLPGMAPANIDGMVLRLDALADEFHYPYEGRFISDYGIRSGLMHTGVDIKAVPNDTIRAAFPGVVRMSKLYSSYGNIVVIRHYQGFETVYAHNSRNLVQVNDVVEAGQPIALAGRTGRATTEHLHFEVRVGYEHFNPRLMIDPERMTLLPGNIYISSTNGQLAASQSTEGLAAMRAALGASSANDRAAIEAARAASSTSQDTPGEAVYYRVKSGDTLSAIALRYSTTVRRLCEMNSIRESAYLQINQRLRIK